jgi:hypothetical protein
MATNDALQPEKGPLARAVLLDRLGGVIGATGEKAAILPQHRADRVLVTANQYQKQFHGLRSSYAFQQVLDFPSQSSLVDGQIQLDRQTNDQVAGRQFGMPGAKDFTHQPLYQGAVDRTAEVALCYDQSQPGTLGLLASTRAVM